MSIYSDVRERSLLKAWQVMHVSFSASLKFSMVLLIVGTACWALLVLKCFPHQADNSRLFGWSSAFPFCNLTFRTFCCALFNEKLGVFVDELTVCGGQEQSDVVGWHLVAGELSMLQGLVVYPSSGQLIRTLPSLC
jgi:hypothetical protein